MRILFSIDTFSAGGKERRLMELMKGLKAKQKIDFELIILSNDIHFKDILELGITVHRFVRRTKKDVSIFKKIYKICKQYKPDLVHCWDSMSAIYLIPTITLLGIKFVNGMVTDAPDNIAFNKYWLRAKITFPFSDIIIGNSQAGLKSYDAPKAKSICIHNGFNFERLKSLVAKEKIMKEINVHTRYVVGMVASFSVYKDYATYFNACQRVLRNRKDVTFLAIGADTDSADSKQLIEDQFMQSFRLLGKRSEIESFINCMDICVLATFTEGVSNSILEYMAIGKPVIATAGGGTVELVEDNSSGFLINRCDPIELSDKIEFLLNNEERRLKMGAAGKRRVYDNFSLNKMVDQFVESYAATISR